MHPWDEPAVAAHYRGVAAALAGHLLRGQARVTGPRSSTEIALPWAGGDAAVSEADADADAVADAVASLITAVDAGGRWVSWRAATDGAPGALRFSPGLGADLATAATAVLTCLESTTAVTAPADDGLGGLLVWVRGTDPAELAGSLARRAPELATGDRDAADGRSWVRALAPGDPVPLPWSLVDAPAGTRVVLPITVDEIAAVTAGMPWDPDPGQAAARLSESGDTSASLLLR